MQSKLCLTLLKKEKYITSLENLILLSQLGVKITKIHKVLKFVAAPYLKRWVIHNTKKRNEAKMNQNLYLDLFYKFIINSTFGKLCENLKGKFLLLLLY